MGAPLDHLNYYSLLSSGHTAFLRLGIAHHFAYWFHKTSIPNATSVSRSHNHSSSDCSISTIDPLIIITMKLVIYFVLVASMNAIDYASAAGLRLTSSQESDAAIATNDLLLSDNNDGRELLSAWCDPATPALWHP